jgi:hypothetical protein
VTYLYRRWLRPRSDWTLRIWPVLHKVVVLTTIHLGGEMVESADILTYNGGGKLVAFETCSDAKVADRVFAR